MTTNFSKLVFTADDRTRDAFSSIQRNMHELEGATSRLAGMLPALGVAFSAAGIAALAKNSIDAADALNDMSKSTGVAVSTLAGLKLAAAQSGVELGTVAKGLGKFSSVVFDAGNGSQEAAAKIARLGLDLNQLKNQNPEQQFFALAGALKGIAADQRPAVLIDVLGQRMAALAPLLDEGADGLSRMAEEGKRANASLVEMAKNADEFNDIMASFKQTSSGLFSDLVRHALPSLNEHLKATKEIVDNGSWIEKLAFFTTGYASGRVLDKVGDPVVQIEKYNAAIKRLELQMKSLGGTEASNSGTQTYKELVAARAGLAAQEARLREVNQRRVEGVASEFVSRRIGIDVPQTGGNNAAKKPIAPIDVFDNASFITRNKEAADFIKQQFKDINELQSEIARDSQTLDVFGGSFQASKESTDFIQQQFKDVNELQGEMARHTDDLKQKYLQLADPLIPYKKQLEELVDLKKQFPELAEQWAKAEANVMEQMDKVTGKTNDTARQLGLTFESALENAIVKGESLRDTFKGLAQDLARLAIRKNLTEPLLEAASAAFSSFGSSGSSSSGGGSSWIGTAVSVIGSFFSGGGASSFANGGIMTPRGPLPLRAYAGGGIANSPQLALFGEGRMNEAFVPLPDGRAIPVKMQGGGGVQVINNYHIDARGAEPGVEERIRRAIRDSEDRAVTRSVTQVQDLNQRGALRFN